MVFDYGFIKKFLVPSKISADLNNKARFIVAHPCNPPYHTPMVELVPAPWTDEKTRAATRQIMAEAGQGPVSLSRYNNYKLRLGQVG